jgi:hypothetical protein
VNGISAPLMPFTGFNRGTAEWSISSKMIYPNVDFDEPSTPMLEAGALLL